MLEIIALFAPALVALRFYNHLHNDKLSNRMLVMSYGIFALLINLCMFIIILYLLRQPEVTLNGTSFISYSISGLVLAGVFPFVVNLIENTLSINVNQNGKQK